MSLDSHFDVIIYGTGLTESILAAALSRASKKVLHFDKNEYYGSETCSVTLTELEDFKLIDKVELDTDLKNKSRKYGIDKTSKPIFCNGPIIQTMISSGIGRSMEFKPVQGEYIYLEGSFQQVPFSKGDIFKNKFISLQEKTYLMKFINTSSTLKLEDVKEFKTFDEFMNSHKLTQKLQDIITYAIAFCPFKKEITCQEGVERLQLFIKSLGKYGDTSFLYPLYGCSELSQLFCRTSCVFGGINILRRGVDKVISDEKKVVSIISEGEEVKCDYYVCNTAYLEEEIDTSNYHVRCVCITDKPLFDLEVSVAVIPPFAIDEKQSSTIFINHLNQNTCTTPEGRFLIHFTSTNIEIDTFKACIEKLKIETKYINYYTIPLRKSKDSFENMFLISNLNVENHMEESVNQAKEIFKKICPDKEFLDYIKDPNEDHLFDQTTRLLGIDETTLEKKQEN